MKRYAYLDIEATHTNWNDAEIIEVGLIIKDEHGDVLDYFESLIRPQNLINEGITELTGISQNMVDNAPEFYKVAPKLYEKLQSYDDVSRARQPWRAHQIFQYRDTGGQSNQAHHEYECRG